MTQQDARHVLTVLRLTPSRAATARLLPPCAQASTIRARKARPCAVRRRLAQFSNVCRSSSDNTSGANLGSGISPAHRTTAGPVTTVRAIWDETTQVVMGELKTGTLDGGRHLSPRRAARILLTRPDNLTGGQAETLTGLTAACPEMTALANLITSFAALLVPGPGNGARLRQWITGARAADLPHVHSFTRGLDLDIQAATAALTLPHHNGRTEGVNTKMIKRQMYGRAGFTLLRHRILLG